MNVRLPIPEKMDNGVTITNYALHAKIKMLEDNKDNGMTLLFLDEFNRAAREVQQEVMNILLNREINGFKIPDNVLMVAAMNPASTNSKFKGNNRYNVNDLDAASKDRLVWLYLETNIKDWLDFATSRYEDDKELGDEVSYTMLTREGQIIDQDIIEFLASNQDMLNNPEINEDASPSPRSWEICSDVYKTYKINKKLFKENVLKACLKGCIGDSAFIALIQFMNSKNDPLITPEEIFAGKEFKEEIIDKFKNNSTPRQMLIVKNAVRYLIDIKEGKNGKDAKRLNQSQYDRLIDLLDITSNDLLVPLMRFIKGTSLNNKLMDNVRYLDLFLDVQKLLS